MYGKKTFLILILCGVLSACSKDMPAPFRWGDKSEKASLKTLSYRRAKPKEGKIRAPLNGGYIFVKKNDTAYSIAKKHDIPLRSFLEANNLKPPYRLYTGQKLIIPSARYHKVKKNDTLYSIAKENNVSLTSLTSTNKIKAPYRITIGQRLILPYASTSTVKTANTYKAPIKTKIPKNVPKRASSKFSKPINGKIVSTFGSKANGLHNDGINIAAKRGTPVKVAENGVIVYSSDKIKGLGKLILVKHDGGWVTAYAHLDKILADKGLTVKKGTTIGTVGNTGSVNSPQLHFEIRKKTKPVNPQRYF